ncbi:PREDICTED: uncharacterized protein LOC109185354 [Ipomoea nil]|uniref:uncharacterized protein LOC109185354 n=1 Tax=Ipomoea nil TaxID=35883 RepID=UPI000900E470|nr:PREDICTED: uncharacterized protein LOC109185354 [Ipomoea nil]
MKKYPEGYDDIPREIEGLCGRILLFKVSVKKEQLKNFNSAFPVIKVVTDPAMLSTYCSMLELEQDKDHILRMVDATTDKEDAEMELSFADEAKSPVNLGDNEDVDLDPKGVSVKRRLLDEFSSTMKKGKAIIVKKEK